MHCSRNRYNAFWSLRKRIGFLLVCSFYNIFRGERMKKLRTFSFLCATVFSASAMEVDQEEKPEQLSDERSLVEVRESENFFEMSLERIMDREQTDEKDVLKELELAYEKFCPQKKVELSIGQMSIPCSMPLDRTLFTSIYLSKSSDNGKKGLNWLLGQVKEKKECVEEMNSFLQESRENLKNLSRTKMYFDLMGGVFLLCLGKDISHDNVPKTLVSFFCVGFAGGMRVLTNNFEKRTWNDYKAIVPFENWGQDLERFSEKIRLFQEANPDEDTES